MADLQGIATAVIEGKRDVVTQKVKQAIDEKVHPGDVLNKGLIAGMSVIGDRFRKNEVYVPEVLIAARAMKAGLAILEPLLVKGGVKPLATVVIGTVKGDLHDIGKNLVAMMMEGAGFEIVDLGVNVSADKFVSAVKEKNADIVAMSAMLTTTMLQMKEVVRALDAAGLRGRVKVMVGGAPVTQRFADEVAADGYAPDAASGAEMAKKLIQVVA